MTIGENVLSGLKLAQLKKSNTDELLESCLDRAGLWSEVKDRLGEHGGHSRVDSNSAYVSLAP
jgi:phosphate transport system ATP-binding protein